MIQSHVKNFFLLFLVALPTLGVCSANIQAADFLNIGSETLPNSWHELELDVPRILSVTPTESTSEATPLEAVETRAPAKQRLLVFTDSGGGGHMAASRAVENILGSKYEIKVITPLMHLPLVASYNKTQKKGNMRALRLLTSMQPVAEFLADHFAIRQLITSEIFNFKPDLIISVIPLVNRLTHAILEENRINTPMLILTTDLEVRHFFIGMNHPGPGVKVSLSFDDENLREPLRTFFSNDNFVSLGFPLRPEFGISAEERQPKIDSIREELGIVESDKTVLIMMGAQGAGKAITKYTSKIAKSSLGSEIEKIHVVALCGNNEELRREAEATSNPKNPNVVIHALGMKPGEYIAALMRLANVLISKPGGASANEAFASELFTLYHTDRTFWHPNRDVLLPWEAGNMNYSIQKKWGERIEKKSFLEQLQRVLNKPRLEIENCEGRNFKRNLQDFVNNLLSVH
ncbi:MAG: hypothetical protein ABIQ95_16690 [Bdellovibrionia bacterium]